MSATSSQPAIKYVTSRHLGTKWCGCFSTGPKALFEPLISKCHFAPLLFKAQEDARRRVMRYSPKGADDIHDCVVMIYQAYGNPQSSASLLRGTPTAAWIKKEVTFGRQKLLLFWWRRGESLSPAGSVRLGSDRPPDGHSLPTRSIPSRIKNTDRQRVALNKDVI